MTESTGEQSVGQLFAILRRLERARVLTEYGHFVDAGQWLHGITAMVGFAIGPEGSTSTKFPVPEELQTLLSKPDIVDRGKLPTQTVVEYNADVQRRVSERVGQINEAVVAVQAHIVTVLTQAGRDLWANVKEQADGPNTTDASGHPPGQ